MKAKAWKKAAKRYRATAEALAERLGEVEEQVKAWEWLNAQTLDPHYEIAPNGNKWGIVRVSLCAPECSRIVAMYATQAEAILAAYRERSKQ